MTTNRVQMETRTPFFDSDAPGFIRRRSQRARILGVLHGICLKIEQTQQSEDARLACREVAHLLNQARANEKRRSTSRKS
jgi:hypothetical protein